MRPFLNQIRCQAFLLNLPSALLILILQRTPVVKIATLVEEIVVAVPLGSVLRSAVVVTAGVGVHSIAGATELAASIPSPLAATVGTPVSVGFSITGTLSEPERWFISGSFPPGVSFGGQTSGTVLGGTILLSGTPTTAGNYTINLQANDDVGGNSPIYNYSINVADSTLTPPGFTVHPDAQDKSVGESVTFTSTATGTPAPTFQWLKNGLEIGGATSSSFTIDSLALADAGSYSVRATNAAGSATSTGAMLTVTEAPTPPSVTAQPPTHSIAVDGSVVFSVEVSGNPQPTIQWQRSTDGGANWSDLADGGVFAGTATATLRVTKATVGMNGHRFRAVVTNSEGSATSNAGMLNVAASTGPRLINLSARASAGAGDNTLIMGFFISGTGSKTLLIRGVGPRLLDFVPPPVVGDPRLVVYKGDTPIDSNDDWDPSLASSFAAVGAFSLNDGSKDAAMTITLQSGLYTVHLVNSGPIGEALIEVYDLSRDLGTRLTNLSCRFRMNPGQVLIVGNALIGGDVPVLVRNVGPELVTYGLHPDSVLADPHLRVFKGNDELAANDDWDPVIQPFFGSAGAFGLTVGSKDAAERLTLTPGGYTVHATGTTGGGVAIVELYESP